MSLSRSRIWVPHQQPSWPLTINRRNPLTRGLIAAWPFLPPGANTLYDVAGYGLHGILTNKNPVTDWSGTSSGISLHFDGQDGAFVDVSSAAASVSPIDGSLGLLARFEGGSESDGVAHALLEFGHVASGDDFIGCRKAASDELVIRYRQAATNTDAIIGSVAGNTWLHVVGAWDSDAVYGYLNGVGQDSTVRGTDISNAFDQGGLGGQGQGPGSAHGDKALNGSVALAYVYSRALVAAEVARLYVNPWQLFCFSAHGRGSFMIPVPHARNYYLGGIPATKRVLRRGLGW